jgi:hypothetical protein
MFTQSSNYFSAFNNFFETQVLFQMLTKLKLFIVEKNSIKKKFIYLDELNLHLVRNSVEKTRSVS